MSTSGPDLPRGHQHWRDQLGAQALGHLSGAEAAAVQAHLDGCASCRAELAEIAPLARMLDTVDPERFAAPPAPAPELGALIRDAVAQEQTERDRADAADAADELSQRRVAACRRRTTRVGLLSAAAALVVVALGAGVLVGRSTDSTPAGTAAPRPYEAIALRDVGGASVVVDRAGLVPHTWGVELELEGTGFDAGRTYRASFRTAGPGGDEMVPAGEFRGIGAGELTCSLQSSVMRDDVDRVVVTDARGRRVLVADL